MSELFFVYVFVLLYIGVGLFYCVYQVWYLYCVNVVVLVDECWLLIVGNICDDMCVMMDVFVVQYGVYMFEIVILQGECVYEMICVIMCVLLWLIDFVVLIDVGVDLVCWIVLFIVIEGGYYFDEYNWFDVVNVDFVVDLQGVCIMLYGVFVVLFVECVKCGVGLFML